VAGILKIKKFGLVQEANRQYNETDILAKPGHFRSQKQMPADDQIDRSLSAREASYSFSIDL